MKLNKSHTGNVKTTTLRHNKINCLKSMIKNKSLNQKEEKKDTHTGTKCIRFLTANITKEEKV